MAYHYGNRRLTFLRSPDLVELVSRLGDHPSARAAFDACGIDARRWPTFAKALASLASSDTIEAVDGTDTADEPEASDPVEAA